MWPKELSRATLDPFYARAEAGLRVDVWTIDREDDMRRLLGWRVDGVMTDRPDLLSRVLREA